MRLIFLLSSLCILLFSCSENENIQQVNQEVYQNEVVWTKTIGGTLDEKTNSVVATNDGGVLVLGYTNSNDGDISKTYDLIDVLVSKFDANGSLVWSKTYGGSKDDFGYSIIPTTDGNFVIAGYSGSSDGEVPINIGFHDFYISKINQQGTLLWTKTYGFSSHDHAHKIIQTKDGGYFVAGFSDYAGIIGTPGDGNHGEGHGFRSINNLQTSKSYSPRNPLHGVGEYVGMKLNENGDFLWYRYFGGTQNDRVNDIVETKDGHFIMIGYSESNDYDIVDNKGGYDFWVVNISPNGHLHWKNNYGGTGIDQAFGIVETNNNSFLIAGKTNSYDFDIHNPLGNFDAWVIHIDKHGHLLWEKTFGGSDFDSANAIKKLSNGNFVVVGNTRGSFKNNINRGENDFWAFEIDNKPNSDLYWQKTIGGSKIDIANDIIQNSKNEIFIVGETQSDDFDVLENKGMNDVLVVKLK